MKTFLYNYFTVLSAFILAVITITSCSNSVGSDEDHEHEEPFGVALIMNGEEIATQENGVVSYLNGDHLEIELGEETDLITVRWIAEDGDRFEADADEGYSLEWNLDPAGVADIAQHEEDGPWGFHLEGSQVGETNISFVLIHNDHADFTSMEFVVHVHE